MRVTLTVIDGPHTGQVFSFAGHDTFLVGRSRRAHFRLPSKDRFFSRVHFLVEVNPPQCRLMDMGSRNGTFVNGQRVEVADLKDNDQIRAGRTILRVAVEEFDAPAPPAAEVALVAAPAPPIPEVVEGIPLPPEDVVPAACLVCETALAGPPAALLPDAPEGICAICQALIRDHPQPIEGYRIVRPIGKGAMGEVYLALSRAENALVALKTVIPAVSGTRTQVERFLREADILRRLAHPHIVSFRASGESGGKIFFAMDYVRGKDANRLLREEGPLPVPRAVRLICQLLEALDHAHRQGFVHRDIKPANLLVSQQDGREVLQLADFGLARVYQASQLSGLTVTGDIGGTVAFMAPEQITSYREVRPSADQYATAASLYNLLTGCYVYDLPRELPRQLALILNEDPVPLRSRRPDVPEELAATVHRALARDPADRFPEVRAFHAALARFAR